VGKKEQMVLETRGERGWGIWGVFGVKENRKKLTSMVAVSKKRLLV
jgi:hypothetical protein